MFKKQICRLIDTRNQDGAYYVLPLQPATLPALVSPGRSPLLIMIIIVIIIIIIIGSVFLNLIYRFH